MVSVDGTIFLVVAYLFCNDIGYVPGAFYKNTFLSNI